MNAQDNLETRINLRLQQLAGALAKLQFPKNDLKRVQANARLIEEGVQRLRYYLMRAAEGDMQDSSVEVLLSTELNSIALLAEGAGNIVKESGK